jgi:tetratricopeptide (TPR) repeat protein
MKMDLTMKKKYVYLIIIILTFSCLAAFGRIAGNEFINFDDNLYITDNYNIQSGFHLQKIKWAFTSAVAGNWHPLTILSHMLDWSLFGDNAAGHHLVSLLLHIGTVIFLFLFLFKTTNNLWPAAFAAAFFALHPLRVESVAWASERKDVLSMFFGMATIYAYAFYTTSSKISKYLLCLALFALSLMSKPMLVTLPFVLLLLDYWPLKRLSFSVSSEINLKAAGRLIMEKIPFFILTIASSLATIWAQNKEGVIASIDSFSFSTRLANAILSYGAYLGKTFWPVNLAVYYPYDFFLPVWKVLIAAFILLFLTAAVIYYMKKLPFLFTGWFLYLGTLIPVIGFVQVGCQAMADRYTYLPSIGIAIMLAWGVPLIFQQKEGYKKILFPAAIAWLIILSTLTFKQCGYWENSFSLFHQALNGTKNNYVAHNNFGLALFEKGDAIKAISHFNMAIAIKNNYALAYNNRGKVYASIKNYQQALDDLNRAIVLNPEYADAHYSKGTLYSHLGEHQQAIRNLSEAIRLKPDYADAYNNRAFIYINLGDHSSGCRDAQKACELGNCKIWESPVVKNLCR